MVTAPPPPELLEICTEVVLVRRIGSHSLPHSYVQPLRDAGVEVKAFATRSGWLNRFQVNFRNHRKIVVVDGTLAFVGGINYSADHLLDFVGGAGFSIYHGVTTIISSVSSRR